MKVKIYKLFSENYDKCYINYTTLCTGDILTNLKRKFIKKEEHPTNILFEKGVKCEILIRNLNFESVKDVKKFLYEYRKNFNVIENKQYNGHNVYKFQEIKLYGITFLYEIYLHL